MWQSEGEKEKQKKLEKLIDWEISKQLTWVVLSLTFFLGLMGVLPFLKLSGTKEFTTPIFFLKVSANAPFIITYLLLIVGLDVSIYRLGTTLERIRNWELRIPSHFMQLELRRTPLDLVLRLFLRRTRDNHMNLRRWLVALVILLADILLLICALFFI